MAAIDRALIPALSLTCIDALLGWGLMTFDEVYSSQPLVNESKGIFQPVSYGSEFRDLDRFDRVSYRVNLKLPRAYAGVNSKLWEKIIETANVSIPPAFYQSGTATDPSGTASINRSWIPASALVSIDAFVSWALCACEELYKSEPIIRESPQISNLPIVVGQYTDYDLLRRLSGRAILKLAPGYKSIAKPLWENILPLNNTLSIAQAFRA
jgi:hypothetical protein